MEIPGIIWHFALSITNIAIPFLTDSTGEWRAVKSCKKYFCCSSFRSLELLTTTSTNYKEYIADKQLLKKKRRTKANKSEEAGIRKSLLFFPRGLPS